jgi:hypothetical protein
MRIQPNDTKLHEIELKELRAERNSEDRRLTTLKLRLEQKMSNQKVTFPSAPDGRIATA